MDGTVEPGQILVLAPRRQFGYAVRDALRKRDVQAHSFFTEESLDGDPMDLDASKAQQAYTLLTLLAKPKDRVGLRCWCGFGNSALSEPAWRRIRQRAEETGESPREVLTKLAAGELSIAHTQYAVERFKVLLAQEELMEGFEGMDLVEALFPQANPGRIPWAGSQRMLRIPKSPSTRHRYWT